jgi:hypothetical protein
LGDGIEGPFPFSRADTVVEIVLRQVKKVFRFKLTQRGLKIRRIRLLAKLDMLANHYYYRD